MEWDEAEKSGVFENKQRGWGSAREQTHLAQDYATLRELEGRKLEVCLRSGKAVFVV